MISLRMMVHQIGSGRPSPSTRRHRPISCSSNSHTSGRTISSTRSTATSHREWYSPLLSSRIRLSPGQNGSPPTSSRKIITPKEKMSCAEEKVFWVKTSGGQQGRVKPGEQWICLTVYISTTSAWQASPKSMILGRQPSQTSTLLRLRSMCTILQQVRNRRPLEMCASMCSLESSDRLSLEIVRWSARVTQQGLQSIISPFLQGKVSCEQLQYLRMQPLCAELKVFTMFFSWNILVRLRQLSLLPSLIITSLFSTAFFSSSAASPFLYRNCRLLTFSRLLAAAGSCCATARSGCTISISLKMKMFSPGLTILGVGICSSFSKQQVLSNSRRHSLFWVGELPPSSPQSTPSCRSPRSLSEWMLPSRVLMMASRDWRVSSEGWRYSLAFSLSPRSQLLKQMWRFIFYRLEALAAACSGRPRGSLISCSMVLRYLGASCSNSFNFSVISFPRHLRLFMMRELQLASRHSSTSPVS